MPQEFYKYVKRSADRFIELGLSDTVEVTKFDVERCGNVTSVLVLIIGMDQRVAGSGRRLC